MDRTDPVSDSDVPSGTTGEGAIELVQEGMRVIDSAGEEIGTVDLVKMGDPEAVTTEGQEAGGEGFLGGIADAFGFGDEPDLPPTLQARLIRFGFPMIDSESVLSANRYLRPDRIAAVSGDTVRLTVPRGRLAEAA